MTANQSDTPAIPIVCDLEAIPAEARTAHEANARRLFYGGKFSEMRELEAGYAFAFPVAELPNVTSYIEYERLCCPFWDFKLHLAPQGEVVWLALTGGNNVKAMMEQEILPQLNNI